MNDKVGHKKTNKMKSNKEHSYKQSRRILDVKQKQGDEQIKIIFCFHRIIWAYDVTNAPVAKITLLRFRSGERICEKKIRLLAARVVHCDHVWIDNRKKGRCWVILFVSLSISKLMIRRLCGRWRLTQWAYLFTFQNNIQVQWFWLLCILIMIDLVA